MRLWHLSPSVNSVFKHACALGLHIWMFVRPFIYVHTLCVRTAKALARLRGSPEPSLFASAISTIISWAGSIIAFQRHKEDIINVTINKTQSNPNKVITVLTLDTQTWKQYHESKLQILFVIYSLQFCVIIHTYIHQIYIYNRDWALARPPV